MDIERAQSRHSQDIGRQDPAIRGGYEKVWPELRQLPGEIAGAQLQRLQDRNAMCGGSLRDRASNGLLVSSDRTVWLSDCRDDGRAGFDEPLERRNGEIGRAHVHDPECLIDHVRTSSPLTLSLNRMPLRWSFS